MRDLRIIFMGTPEFAVPSLDILVENKFNVVAVITAPDKPAGRGLTLKASAVKEAALRHSIPVLQPTSLKDPAFLEELTSYNANLQVVVAFRMLPEAIWSYPEFGTFNLHASLLPNYRGAAPINWAIINGEKETGCTTFFLKHEIDTGNIIYTEKEPIEYDDTIEALYGRLMNKGSLLVLKTVQSIASGEVKTFPQNEAEAKHAAPKIHKETCAIDWKKSAEEIRNFIRGLSPIPAAWTTLDGKQFKIFKASVSNESSTQHAPGTILSDGKKTLEIATGKGLLKLDELQPEGKKRMTVEEFLRGYKLPPSIVAG
jgi:methionyl-tRNA formyltransferase